MAASGSHQLGPLSRFAAVFGTNSEFLTVFKASPRTIHCSSLTPADYQGWTVVKLSLEGAVTGLPALTGRKHSGSLASFMPLMTKWI